MGAESQDAEKDAVKNVLLAYRLNDARERCIGMTDEERAWRKQFLKDQILDHDEPIISQEYLKQKYNPIRRFYRAPMNKVENMLVPLMGKTGATAIRHTISKTIMGITFIYFACYYMKYNRHDWTRFGGWKFEMSRPVQYPSDPGFPNFDRREKGNQYVVYGFDKSPI